MVNNYIEYIKYSNKYASKTTKPFCAAERLCCFMEVTASQLNKNLLRGRARVGS